MGRGLNIQARPCCCRMPARRTYDSPKGERLQGAIHVLPAIQEPGHVLVSVPCKYRPYCKPFLEQHTPAPPPTLPLQPALPRRHSSLLGDPSTSPFEIMRKPLQLYLRPAAPVAWHQGLSAFAWLGLLGGGGRGNAYLSPVLGQEVPGRA